MKIRSLFSDVIKTLGYGLCNMNTWRGCFGPKTILILFRTLW